MARLGGLQRWLAAHTPDAILFYPFEVFFCVLCLLAGPQLLLSGPVQDGPAVGI